MEKRFINLVKLCVGINSVTELEIRQRKLLFENEDYNNSEFTFHVTRMFPQKEKEILSGGSLYWVIKGQILARQKITALKKINDDNDIKRCLLILERKIYLTQSQPRKPFQGWRYLKPEITPKDISIYNKKKKEIPHKLQIELYKMGVL